jgi:hypothetical protein
MPSITRTIRIDEEVDRNIEEIASKRRITVNTLRNSILRRYVERDYYAERFGAILTFSACMDRIMDMLTDGNIEELARWTGRDIFKEYAMFSFKKVDLDSVLKVIRQWGQMGNFQYEERVVNGEYHIICQHDGRPKMSKYYSETLRSAFRHLLSIDVKIESTEHQVSVRFRPPTLHSSAATAILIEKEHR